MAKTKHKSKNLLYTSTKCRYCKQLKAYLRDHKVPYMEFNIETNRRAAIEYSRLGFRSVPVLTVNGQSIQGFNEKMLKRFLKIP